MFYLWVLSLLRRYVQLLFYMREVLHIHLWLRAQDTSNACRDAPMFVLLDLLVDIAHFHCPTSVITSLIFNRAPVLTSYQRWCRPTVATTATSSRQSHSTRWLVHDNNNIIDARSLGHFGLVAEVVEGVFGWWWMGKATDVAGRKRQWWEPIAMLHYSTLMAMDWLPPLVYHNWPLCHQRCSLRIWVRWRGLWVVHLHPGWCCQLHLFNLCCRRCLFIYFQILFGTGREERALNRRKLTMSFYVAGMPCNSVGCPPYNSVVCIDLWWQKSLLSQQFLPSKWGKSYLYWTLHRYSNYSAAFLVFWPIHDIL